MSENIEIKADNYSVHIGGLKAGVLSDFIHSKYDFSDCYILVDENTKEHCLPKLRDLFADDGTFAQMGIVEIPAGEGHKTLETVTSIERHLSTRNASRGAVLINLGGGVVCDVGGFAASIYKRGIDFINVPTTLLSQVDASIGGKVGVDLDGLKNYLGVFKNPTAVYIDPTFLTTLEQKEVIAGYAEVIKHALIADNEYLGHIRDHDLDVGAQSMESWKAIIEQSVNIKNRIVTEDPKEEGVRKTLNFGHTIGHALESFYLGTDTPLLHGEAVAIGMVCELYLSSVLTGLGGEARDDVCSYLSAIYQKRKLDLSSYNEYIASMYADKKNRGGKINFTLLTAIGSPLIDQYVDEESIRQALDYYRSL
jgi:3-dehydroquinate synthase